MRLLVGVVVDGWVGYQYRNAHLSSLGEGYSTPSLNESLNPFVPNQGPFPSLDRDIDINLVANKARERELKNSVEIVLSGRPILQMKKGRQSTR